MTQPWDQAVAYVQALRAQGYTDSDLWTALRGGGWTEAEIQALLSGAAPPEPAPMEQTVAPQPPTAPTQPLPQVPPPAVPPGVPLPGPARPAVYASAPTGSSAGSKAPLIIALVAIGVVVLIGLGLVAFFVGRSTAPAPGAPQIAEKAPPEESPGETVAEPEKSESAETTEEPAQPDEPQATSAAGIPNGAGSGAALEAARQAVGEGQWDCALCSRTDDWRQVTVWCTPIDEEGATWVYEVGLQWADASSAHRSAYQVTLIDPGRPPSAVQVVSPWEGRPCLAGALIAARRGLESDWIALLASRTRDWTRATVWVGPPASEYVAKITVQWYADRKLYGVVNEQQLVGDEEPPGQTQVIG